MSCGDKNLIFKIMTITIFTVNYEKDDILEYYIDVSESKSKQVSF